MLKGRGAVYFYIYVEIYFVFILCLKVYGL